MASTVLKTILEVQNGEYICILFASGVYGLVELIRNWKTQQVEVSEEPQVQQSLTG